MRTDLPITTGFYKSNSIPVAAQECTNFYVNIPETQAYTKEQVFHTPGIIEILDVGTSRPNRGAHVMAGVPYFVCGQRLIRLDRSVSVDGIESFSYVDLGEIEGASYVSLADNGEQLCIVVPGYKGYIYNRTLNTLTTITAAAYYDLGPSQKVVYASGYFIHQAAKNVYSSDLNDGLSYSGLDFAEAEADPDDITGIHVNRGQLFVGGTETTEGWQNTGALEFPYQRIAGYIMPIGIIAKHSIVDAGNTFCFVGNDIGGQAAIYQFTGNGFDKISTGAIEWLLLQYSQEELQSIIGFQYSQNGGVFAGWILPDTAIVYDAKTGRWHERKSFINGEQTRWRANCVVQAYGRFLVGDYKSGKIGELSLNTYQEFGEYVRRRVTAGPFNNSGGATFWTSVQLIVESGTDTVEGRGPTIDMSYSDDGGKTWSTPVQRSIGEVGKYTQQPTWNRLGLCRNARVYRFDYADNAKLNIIGLIGEFDGGR